MPVLPKFPPCYSDYYISRAKNNHTWHSTSGNVASIIFFRCQEKARHNKCQNLKCEDKCAAMDTFG